MQKHKITSFFSSVPSKVAKCNIETVPNLQHDANIGILEPSASSSSTPTSVLLNVDSSGKDISSFVNRVLSSREKFETLNSIWVPNENFKFPVKPVGKKKKKPQFPKEMAPTMEVVSLFRQTKRCIL